MTDAWMKYCFATAIVLALGSAPATAGIDCGGTFPTCDGMCPPDSSCMPTSLGGSQAATSGEMPDGCGCFRDIILPEPCGIFPECGGICPIGLQCLPGFLGEEDPGTTSQIGPDPCFCQPVFEPPCGIAPECGGECPLGFECAVDFVAEENPGATTQGGPDIIIPCFCRPVRLEFCGTAPECGGSCEPGSTCRTGFFFAEGKSGAGATTQGPDEEPCFCIPDTPPGACCLPEGTCEELMVSDCEDRGGAFLGEDTSCDEAQCSDPGTFTTDDCATPFEDISASGTPLVLSDDDGAVVPIGFSFSFFSNSHTEVGVSSNGYLTFGSDLTIWTTEPIPDPSDPNAFIAPFWDDFNPGFGGTVHVQTAGSAPNRRFIAQWTDVPEFFGDGANTFQVILFEGNNTIDFRYGPFSSAFGVVGVENAVGNDGESIPFGDIAPGVCIQLTPFEIPDAAPAPALDDRSLAALIATLLAIAMIAIQRVRTPAR